MQKRIRFSLNDNLFITQFNLLSDAYDNFAGFYVALRSYISVVVTHPFISVYSCATINVWPYSSLLWWHVSKRALRLLKGSCKRTFALNGYRLWNFNCLIVHGENRLLSCEWMANKAKTVPWGISLPISACFIPQRQASLSPASCPLESWTQTQIKVWSLLSESKCHMAMIKSYQNCN